MRIESIEIKNYRGIQNLSADGLGSEPIITIAGPNGSGKSLMFEAIAGLWASRFVRPARFVGPWGATASVRMTVSFTEDEADAFRSFAVQNERPIDPTVDLSSVSLAAEIDRLGGAEFHVDPPDLRQFLQSDVFTSENRFAHVDFLPSDRTIQRGETPVVDVGLLGYERAKQFRQQVTYQYLETRGVVPLSGVQSFLASLDYQELLAEREGTRPPDNFTVITEAFGSATGKVIRRPTVDAARGAVIDVEAPSGSVHGVDDLSHGEQEVLGLMYFARRLSSEGGVLLIDEPELHLHQALQRSLFSVFEDVAERAQIFIATHAPKLITVASLEGILHVRPPDGSGSNQATRASHESERTQVLEALGVDAVDLLQNDMLLVVEGSTDRGLLSLLLPIETGRALFLEAGNGDSVMQASSLLETEGFTLPHLCIRDRDLMSDEEVTALVGNHSHLFIWPGRSVESEFLHPPLLARTLERSGYPMSPDAVAEALREIADSQMERILAELVDARLRRDHDVSPESTSTPLERLAAYYTAASETAIGKLDALDEAAEAMRAHLEAIWPDQWFRVMDSKEALGRFVQLTPFTGRHQLTSAVAQTMRDEREYESPGVAALRAALPALSTPGGSASPTQSDNN